jgi:hypothetical protein
MTPRCGTRSIAWIALGAVSVLIVAFERPTAAAAAPPTSVTITVLADFSGPVPQGTFKATSPLCSSGAFLTEPIAGGGGPVASAFTGLQHFSCDDASGTFTILFHPQVHPPDYIDQGPWAALGGTGAYDGLRGSGDFMLLAFITPSLAVATFTGDVHFD